MKPKGALVVISSIIIMLCLGAAYSWGIFIKPIQNDLGWTRANISLAVSFLLLTFSVFVLIGGLIEKKIGAYKTITISGVLLLVAWMGASFAQSLLELYFFYGLLGGVATGLGYNLAIASGITCYPEKKGLIIGVIVFGFGLGAAIISPLMTLLIQNLGWRLTMRYGGITFGLVILLAGQFFRPLSNHIYASKEKQSNGNESLLKTGLFKTPNFWVLFITYFMAMVAGMMIIGHVAAFATDQGLTAVEGAVALTLLAVFNGVGRVLFGYLCDKLTNKFILIVLFIMISLGMFLFASADSLLSLNALAAFIGLCFGGFLAVYPSLTVNLFGHRRFSVNYGLVFIGYGMGCFTGPLLAGWLYDLWNHYSVAFYLASLIALSGAILVFFGLSYPGEKKAPL